MKKIALYSVLLLALACKKQDVSLTVSQNKPEACDFLKGDYNTVTRGDLADVSNLAARLRDTDKDGIADNRDNCPKTYNPDQKDSNNNGIGDACETQTTTTNTSTVSTTSWVVFLDFDGQSVNTPYWNNGTPFYCTPSGFSSVEIQNIITEVKNDYSQFKNIIITTDSAVYFSVTAAKRQRVIITENNAWYPGAGGVAYAESLGWGLEVPAFVFSKALGYNQKYNWEATSHETGHTLGLYHQTLYDANCNFLKEYNPGGNGEAPIMGVSYYQAVGKWWIGTSVYGCSTTQNDALIIANKVK
jgi:hypothetical protein